MENESELNLNAATLDNLTQAVARDFDLLNDALLPAIAVLIFFSLVAMTIMWASKKEAKKVPAGLEISNWPVALKLALIPLLVSYALTHLFSLGSVYYNTKVANGNSELYFQNLGIGRLFALSHAHLFAHATMYFLLATLVQFTGKNRFFTLWAPIVALWAGVFDVVSWWGYKKVSPEFEILSAFCGSSFSLGFLLMAFAILSSAFCSKKQIT